MGDSVGDGGREGCLIYDNSKQRGRTGLEIRVIKRTMEHDSWGGGRGLNVVTILSDHAILKNQDGSQSERQDPKFCRDKGQSL
jgi:hypothetical protein